MALAVLSTTALAHGRGRVHLGFHFGVPFYHPFWYHPAPVYYPVYVPPPSPPVYVERDPAPQENWWYYCETSRGYYPYVKECPAGWQRVPPAPAPAK